MNKLQSLKSDAISRGESVLALTADVVESVVEKNLALTADVSGFAIAQMRLPLEVESFSDYRAQSQTAIKDLGGRFNEYGRDMYGYLKGVPSNVKTALTAEEKKSTKVAKKAASTAKKAASAAKKAAAAA